MGKTQVRSAESVHKQPDRPAAEVPAVHPGNEVTHAKGEVTHGRTCYGVKSHMLKDQIDLRKGISGEAYASLS